MGENVSTAIAQYIRTGQVNVTAASPVLIVDHNGTRRSVVITNTGSKTMYIGDSRVTSTTGKRVKADESITLDRNQAAIYAICGGADATTADYIEE